MMIFSSRDYRCSKAPFGGAMVGVTFQVSQEVA